LAAILIHKSAHRFRVHFDDFGTGEHEHLTTQVIRVTRPSLKFHEDFGIPEVALAPIEIDLRDDVADLTRSEVTAQLIKQIKQDRKFAMVIETLQNDTLLEQWRLNECRIAEVTFDELGGKQAEPLLIRLVVECDRLSVVQNGQMVNLL
jgi:hypothetical protein